MSSFKENLNRARVLKGLTQEKLASIVGVRPAFISLFERGYRIPSQKNLKKIAEALDVSVEELTGDDRDVIRQEQIIRNIKRLSPNSLETLGEMADFLRSKEENSL